MTIRVALNHRTVYRFDRPTTVHPHVVRLRPAPHTRTPVTAYSLTVRPEGHFVNWQQDAFGNHQARLVFPERVRELSVEVDLVADLTVINPFDFFVEEDAERYPFTYAAGVRSDLEPYLRSVHGTTPALREWMAGLPDRPEGGTPIVDFLVAVNRAVHRDVGYTVRLEPGVQTPEETLRRGLGSCRDSAWLLVAVLRELGLAARFVSGYLVQLRPDPAPVAESSDDEPAGPGGPAEDFTDLHAWAEVFVPGAGWIGLDATSGLLAGEGHIPLSATPHPATSAPITGAISPHDVRVEFEFANTVTRIHEDVRVTRPYSEGEWERIGALGLHVDKRLDDGDVRLTMGGEPTFVSVADMEAAEWNTAADGPAKRRLAAGLAERLRRRWAHGGVVHHGQGKWYPGEPLPRWQIALVWRRDGEPLWGDAGLLADPWGAATLPADPAEADRLAARLAEHVARRLGVPPGACVPGYEDRLYDLWQEALRPSGAPPEDDVDPDDPELADPAARQRRATAFDGDPSLPVGWVLPLQRDPDGTGWATSTWRVRRGRLFLTPGTSPMGYRLPLDSLAWTPPPDRPDRSPYEPRGPLPAHEPLLQAGGMVTPARDLPVAAAARTALCVQPRDGRLCVFLPPLDRLEDAVELLAAVESGARELGTPVVLEGYGLPGDPRTASLTVTPDPGVVEVNVQPSASWADLTELVETLYEDAARVGLGTEKFDLDGLHTGTGGGNHLTLGGATPADSPLLRRPDLLRSLITYWQHHPALSYVFAGRFVGPTSQSPRVDEGRHESLYELEIAFAELDRTARLTDRSGGPIEPRPWLTDRLLRHLLTDITGNTHRAEFCIDKLWSPDGNRGRLGLLELRGFEMPPHPRMALVQALLVRALVSRFWERPYQGDLVRWGTRLHDRFLLPAFAAADLREVVADLNDHLLAGGGPEFEASWLEPFLEFRFPRLGEADVAGVHLELRQAIEPWHVLGEEVGLGGTARYVDSSVEKVQVAASGLVESRHVLTCNGVPVPLVPVPSSAGAAGAAGTAGAFVGGVRYRAWAPPSALHPTMGVQAPLVFDLVDRWNRRSLGGFTYHVVHPGGRAYDRYPVNAAEAESRRAARFETAGHTAGPVDTTAWSPDGALTAPPGGEYPATLDLRRPRTR